MIEQGREQKEASARGGTARFAAPPEQAIRDYLDARGGLVEVPAHHLLTSWRLERFDENAAAVVSAALERGGISVDPPLRPGLLEDASIVLRLRPSSDHAPLDAGAPHAPERPATERPAVAEAFRAARERVARAVDLTPLAEAAHAAHERLAGEVDRLAARRRLAKLRAQYDVRLRTFGGMVFELYRADARRPELIRRWVEELHASSAELAELERRVGATPTGAVCGSCGLYCGDARFCLACGEEVSPRPRHTRMSTPALVIAVLLGTGAWMSGGISWWGDDEGQGRPGHHEEQGRAAALEAQTSGTVATPAYRSLVAHVRRRGKFAVFRREGGAVKRRLSNPNADGAPLVFLVKRLTGRWAQVYLPSRPNGSTGWIKLSEVSLRGHNYRVVVDVRRRRLTAYRGDHAMVRVPVGVGRAVTPTPAGLYYITELLKQPDRTGIYGPWAFGLSAHSDVLDEFAGADGILGIHGTNEPWAIGKNVSHGCIRVDNRTITRLARTLPVGTPVRIRRT